MRAPRAELSALADGLVDAFAAVGIGLDDPARTTCNGTSIDRCSSAV